LVVAEASMVDSTAVGITSIAGSIAPVTTLSEALAIASFTPTSDRAAYTSAIDRSKHPSRQAGVRLLRTPERLAIYAERDAVDADVLLTNSIEADGEVVRS
jgi:hypothetical protein